MKGGEAVEQAKRAYIKPKLVVYGDLRKLTLNGGAPNMDNPQGPNNNAWPNIS